MLHAGKLFVEDVNVNHHKIIKKENKQFNNSTPNQSDNTLLQNLLSKSSSSKRKNLINDNNIQQTPTIDNQTLNQLADASTRSKTSGADVLLQFSPLVSGQIKQAQVTYISPHSASESADSTSMQAGVLLVASTRADLRRAFIERLCQAAVERSALVYSIATQGGVNVSTDGVYKLSTHPTLSRRAILNALLRHGAHLLVFGTISTRDDVMSLMDAAYTGYHCVAEIYGESAHDVLSRLEAIGVDVSMLPQNLRIVVPANTTSSLT
ncbi:predicted protein [Naegleria gruberi]|uniref:Predicted protein n=1 Tax=Naegleria gruberi TaxID=5762 RepID=D2V882_NAEGR|nr:uncharacterized protein NAEGRDRAFT_65062 [Naegleria gruberi]EFC46998.1 predicted protein [Naegleria gruberi]|eukprot:XP_002679742.1 predicted protein [Naegleria gruberi strain NEG-M]